MIGIKNLLLRALKTPKVRPVRRASVRARPACQSLEHRVVPTTNLILDFDGGSVPATIPGMNYFPVGGSNTVTWNAYVAHQTPSGATANRTEQILQIVNAVRHDYSDWDVNVVWDDRGTNSPFFTATASVIMVAHNPNTAVPGGGGSIIGLAPLDLDQSSANVGLVFCQTMEAFATGDDVTAWVADVASTISHEAGHSFGQSHDDAIDSLGRLLMAPTNQSNVLDGHFTKDKIMHSGENLVYAEYDRNTQNLGFAKSGATLRSGYLELPGQTLKGDGTSITLDGSGVGTFTGSVTYLGLPELMQIDFGGDRDAFRIDLKGSQTYAIRQRAATGSNLDPIFTIFDSNGDFVAKGSQGTSGGVSLLNFTPSKSGTYYLVAGSSYDQATSGVLGTRTLGAYNLEVTPTWYELDSRTKTIRLGGDAGPNIYSAVLTAGGLKVSADSNSITIPTSQATSVEFSGAGGDDRYTIDLRGGPVAASIVDTAGFDRLTVLAADASNFFTMSSILITNTDGSNASMAGIDDITMSGGTGVDIFDVTAGVAAVHIFGGNPTPPSFPGDQLNIATAGGQHTIIATGNGFFDFVGGARVDYDGMESVGSVEVPPPPPPPPPPPTDIAKHTSFAVGSGPGQQSRATLYLNGRDTATYEVIAFGDFRGGVRVATGDINGDGTEDMVVAAGPGGGPHVKVYSGKLPQLLNNQVGSFFAFDGSFRGGINVATGDVNADGYVDIICAADAGGGPHVKVFSGQDGSVIGDFFAYDASFRGGTRVATGDIDGDGAAEIITGAGAGGGPHVRVWTYRGELVKEYFAYESSFTGGVYVATADANNDGKADIITGAGEGGSAAVTIRDAVDLGLLARFQAFTSSKSSLFTGDSVWSNGVRVATTDTDGDGQSELYVTPGRGRSALMRAYLLSPVSEIWNRNATDPNYLGGGVVGA